VLALIDELIAMQAPRAPVRGKRDVADAAAPRQTLHA
jgi:hypothetical protein